MASPSWTREVEGWPPDFTPGPRSYSRLVREGDRWRLIFRQFVNEQGDRAIRYYVEPWGWCGPDEPRHHLLLQRDAGGRWAIWRTYGSWWTPLWFKHAENSGWGRDQGRPAPIG